VNTLRNYTAALSEAVGSGRTSKVMIGNLVPYQICSRGGCGVQEAGIDRELLAQRGIARFQVA